MFEERDIRQALQQAVLVRSLERVRRRNHLRIETDLRLPDGSFVDVFLAREPQLDIEGEKVTDFGQTMEWLSHVNVKPWLSARRREILEDAIGVLGVQLNGGALECSVTDITQVASTVSRVAQACVRVADMIYLRRSVVRSTFLEDVEEMLSGFELEFEPRAELRGRNDRLVNVDFLVTGPRAQSAVLTFGSGHRPVAHNQANEIFTKWYDLAERDFRRVTVYDDRHDTYKDEDLDRLSAVSDVLPASRPDEIHAVLAA